ncbi:MAG TPA: TonB-dependent receptor, partial [Bacteroidia bacterium]
LTGAITAIPGVNELTLGAGITKPVIRGLRGNRVLTILNGFRFDNQQWQDEHGLGLSDMGISRVEVIKGPASVIYGSDAMGGVINLVEEEPAPIGKTVGSFSTKFNTNTIQLGGEVSVKSSSEKMNWKINFGGESNTNYVDGKGNLAYNTRFSGGALKLGLGFTREKFVTSFNYNFSDYSFGFVDAGEFKKQTINFDEERFTRSMEDAYHTVMYHLLYNKTTFFLKNSRLLMDVGAHLNHRLEHEGAEEAGIGNMDMELNNYSINLRWVKPIHEHHELILGTQDMFVTNTNLGKRFIIPDAISYGLSGYAFLKHSYEKLVVEEGFRFNMDGLSTKSHGDPDSLLAVSGAWMPAITRTFSTGSASLGFSYMPVKEFLVKFNIATGERAPNLAELSANGFHEGFVYYEKGDNNLQLEHNMEGDLSIRYGTEDFKIEGSAFYNDVFNFIYLAPSDSFFNHRFIYYYKQTDAVLYGGEAGFDWEPGFAKWLDIKSSYSTVTAVDKSGNYIPRMPADRVTSSLIIRFHDGKRAQNNFVKATVINVLEQWKISTAETHTPGYTLVNLSMGSDFQLKNVKVEVSLFCNNLLNAYYYDHLSLVKPGSMPGGYGFYGMGRNMGLALRFPLGK